MISRYRRMANREDELSLLPPAGNEREALAFEVEKSTRRFAEKFNLSPRNIVYYHEKKPDIYPLKVKPGDTLHVDKLTTNFADILRDGSLFRFNTRINKYEKLMPNEKKYLPIPPIKTKDERLQGREKVTQLRHDIEVEEKRFTGELTSEKAYIHKCEEEKRKKRIRRNKRLRAEALRNVIDDANSVQKIHHLMNDTVDSVFIEPPFGASRFLRQRYHIWHSLVDKNKIPPDVFSPDSSIVSDQESIPGLLYSDDDSDFETDSDYD